MNCLALLEQMLNMVLATHGKSTEVAFRHSSDRKSMSSVMLYLPLASFLRCSPFTSSKSVDPYKFDQQLVYLCRSFLS